MLKIAILIDGAYFLRRMDEYLITPTKLRDITPKQAANYIQQYSHQQARHASALDVQCLGMPSKTTVMLYRTFFYDCSPLKKFNEVSPISGDQYNPSKRFQPRLRFREELHQELTQQPFMALRLGRSDEGEWILTRQASQALRRGDLRVHDLKDEHFVREVRQKGLDMKIGLDIASLAYKRLVDQILLIAGDTDFVPALKLARKEGLSVVLDPLGQTVAKDLQEHVDLITGLSTQSRLSLVNILSTPS